MLRATVASLAGLLLALPASASALPASNPPGKSPAGITLSWPLKRDVTVVTPGHRLTVKVRSASRKIRLSLDLVDGVGRTQEVEAKRTLRRGTFVVKPTRAGLYALRLAVAGKHYWSWLVVGHDTCYEHGTTAELKLSTTNTVSGAALPYEIVNTSRGCVSVGQPYGFQQLRPDGTWVPVPSGQAFHLAATILGGGQSFAKTALIPATFAPGTYQLTDRARGASDIPLSAVFQITG